MGRKWKKKRKKIVVDCEGVQGVIQVEVESISFPRKKESS